jgi:uncharacterized protein YhaN
VRIVRLDLKAFGSFTGASLDFSGGAPGGLHVVYGPNEAGKSTALRAVRDLLYGFEHRTPDAHLHRSEDLRIGGLLEGAGRTLYVQRIKRRKDSLLDEQGSPLDDALLRKLLSGVDRETFTRSFGLDHQELEEHGERLLRGESSVGETLFDAGAGGVDVRRLLETLRLEQEKLYRPRTGKQEINRLLEQHAAARSRLKDELLLPESFNEQVEKLAAARAELAELAARIEAARAERHRLLDLRKALPALQRRAEYLTELAALGDVVFVSEAAAKRRELAESRAVVARANIARLEEESERRARRLAQLEVPHALLGIGEARVTHLADAPGRTRKAREDLPRREAELVALKTEARASLRRLGRGDTEVGAEDVRLSASERGTIRELSTAWQKLEELRRGAAQRRTETQREIDERKARLLRLPPAGNVNALARVASLSRSFGDVETKVLDLAAKQAELVALAEAGRAELRPPCPTLASLRALPVPSLETLERFAEETALLTARETALGEAKRRLAAQAVEARLALQRIQAAGDVPRESDLATARSERTSALESVLGAWRSGAPFAENAAVSARERAEYADHLADRLRREADRVAALAHALLDVELAAAHEQRLADEHAELARSRATLKAEYSAAWRESGLTPLPPAEMRAWLVRRARVLEQSAQARALDAELELARSQRTQLDGAVSSVLGDAAPGDPLPHRVERCAALQAEQTRLTSERAELERTLDTLSARLAHETREVERTEEALEAWRAAWADAVRPLGAGAETPPVAALEMLEEITALAETLKGIEGLERRVKGIRRDEAELAAEVGELAREHGIPFDAKAPDAAAEAIVARYRSGQSARDERARIEADSAERDEHLALERAALAEAERELSLLAREVNASSPAELPALEAKSKRARELEAHLLDLEAALVDQSGGRSVAVLVAEASGEDAPRLSARLEALGRELEELEEARNRAQDRAASIQAGQREQSDALGAEAAQEEQTLGAALAERVGRYTTLRVATTLLERAIERYRLENQGPILKRAGELFPRLTDEGYVTLRVGRDERGIVAVRADGSELAPDALSTGTRYQLYLALRLASVERFVAGAEPLPLVLDDVTIHVDDARKARTFEVLAEVSSRVQVLFFTHSARDAELARTGTKGTAYLHELVRSPLREEPQISTI